MSEVRCAECGAQCHYIRIGRIWCYTKPDKQDYYWVGYAWSGYAGDSWPLHFVRKRYRKGRKLP